MADEIKSQIKEIAKDLLEKLEIKAEVAVEDGEEGSFKVVLNTEETGLLIGHHGETLNSFQLILGIILFKKLGVWTRVLVDVGDYRKLREESIKEMVNRIVSEVELGGQPVTLPFLTPLERRIVHVMLTDHEKVMSESTGEGRERRLTIRPKASES